MRCRFYDPGCLGVHCRMQPFPRRLTTNELGLLQQSREHINMRIGPEIGPNDNHQGLYYGRRSYRLRSFHFVAA